MSNLPRSRRDAALSLAVAVAALIAAFALIALLLRTAGAAAALRRGLRAAAGRPPLPFLLLFIEECGVPLPVPGDLLVALLGRGVHNIAAGVVLLGTLLAAVLAGSSLLYAISARLGHRLLGSRFAPLLDLEPDRVERLDRWFRDWGLLAVVVGRWIPGFRVGTTIVAATFDVPYPVFILGVAIHSVLWISLFLYLGALLRRRLLPLLAAHHQFDAIAPAVLGVAVLAYLAFHALHLKRRAGRASART